jgi:homoserine O-acetyltransferase/O-succinyltransferase
MGARMKKLLFLLVITRTLIAQNPAEKPEQHEFAIKNFPTESGAALPEAHVVYGTYGQLNAAKDNAVLLPSHYMANFHGYEWRIGHGNPAGTTFASI